MLLRSLATGFLVLATLWTTGCCRKHHQCCAPCTPCCTSCCSSPIDAEPATFAPTWRSSGGFAGR